MALHVAQLPREESQVADSTEAAEASPEPSLLRHVFHVKNLEEFDALAAGEVVGRFMRVQYRRTPVAGPTNREDHVVLGIVHETPELAHAIVRTTFQIADEVAPDAAAFAFFTQGRRSWVDVLTLRRTSAGWRSHLNGGLITSGAGGFSIGYDHTDDEHPEASASRER